MSWRVVETMSICEGGGTCDRCISKVPCDGETEKRMDGETGKEV